MSASDVAVSTVLVHLVDHDLEVPRPQKPLDADTVLLSHGYPYPSDRLFNRDFGNCLKIVLGSACLDCNPTGSITFIHFEVKIERNFSD